MEIARRVIIVILLLLFSGKVYAMDATGAINYIIPGSSVLLGDKDKQDPKDNTTSEKDNNKEVSLLLGILKDKNKLNSLIKALEGQVATGEQGVVVSEDYENKPEEVNQNLEKEIIVQSISLWSGFKKQVSDIPSTFKEEVNNIVKADLSTILVVAIIPILCLVIAALLELLSFRFIVKKLIKRFSPYFYFDNNRKIYTYLLDFLWVLLIIGTPIIVIFGAVMTIADNYKNYDALLYYPLLWLAGFLFLARVVNLLFINSKNMILQKMTQETILLGWIVSLFLLCSGVLIQNIFTVSLLLKLILFIFVALSIVVFYLLLRNIFLLLSTYKISFPNNFKRYNFIFSSVVFLILEIAVVSLQYNTSEYIVTRCLLSFFIIFLVYFISKILYFVVFDILLRSIQDSILKLYKRLNISFDNYKTIDLFSFSKVIVYIYSIWVSLWVISRLDNLWGINVFSSSFYIYIINKWYVSIAISILVALLFVYLVTFIFLIIINTRIIVLIKNGSYFRVNKILTLITLLKNPYRIVCLLIIFISLISSLNISFSAILASTGAVGILVAFGAKDILQNLFNGILYFLEDSFSLNDSVRIGGISGIVESISLMYIAIRDSDGVLNFVPFSQVNTIANLSKNYSYAIIDIKVYSDQNVEKIKDIMFGIEERLTGNESLKEEVLDSMEFIGVISFEGDYNITLRFRVKTKANKASKVKFYMFEEIKKEFAKENISVPSSQYIITSKR